jgi:predicted 2-oxoglutarate/Fe(II)-dependent dioxygenase YbiX
MESVTLAPSVLQYEFPEKLAKNLMELMSQLSESEWVKSGISNDDNKDQDYRTSQTIEFGKRVPFWDDEVRRITTPILNDYSEKYQDALISQDEGFQLLRYGISNKYDFHSDGAWSVYRTVSMIVYLNPSEYEGGETYFKHFDLKVKPETPSVVVFPSNYAYLHAAMPVIEGQKFILVNWMNDLPRGLGPNTFYDMCRVMGRI